MFIPKCSGCQYILRRGSLFDSLKPAIGKANARLVAFLGFGHNYMMGNQGVVEFSGIFKPKGIGLVAFQFKVYIVFLEMHPVQLEKSRRIGYGAQLAMRFFKNLDALQIYGRIGIGYAPCHDGLLGGILFGSAGQKEGCEGKGKANGRNHRSHVNSFSLTAI
jgi:hypothetical protein